MAPLSQYGKIQAELVKQKKELSAAVRRYVQKNKLDKKYKQTTFKLSTPKKHDCESE